MSKTLADRLTALETAIWNGASNPALIKRANRLADDIEPVDPAIASRLRVALTTRWESLDVRSERVAVIRRDLAAVVGPDTSDDDDTSSITTEGFGGVTIVRDAGQIIGSMWRSDGGWSANGVHHPDRDSAIKALRAEARR